MEPEAAPPAPGPGGPPPPGAAPPAAVPSAPPMPAAPGPPPAAVPPAEDAGIRRPGTGAASLAIAVLLALGIRFFVIEPFRIPTGSMAPTLLGEHAGGPCPACGFPCRGGYSDAGSGEIPATGEFGLQCQNCLETWPAGPDRKFQIRSGDRVLVFRPLVSWGLRTPDRWSIVVFRPPGIPGKNFIKRLVGLPGERIRIQNGDLWREDPKSPGAFEILRKPPAVQEALWQHVHDTAFARADGRTPWEKSQGDAAPDKAGGFLLSARPERPAAIEFRRPIQDFTDYNQPPRPNADALQNVGDARVLLEASGESGASLEVRLRGVARQDSRTVRFGGTGEPPDAAPAGRTVRIRLERRDGQVLFACNGRERIEEVGPGDPLAEVPLEIRASGAPVRIERIRVQRDIHYRARIEKECLRPDERVAIPTGVEFRVRPDAFLLLGDNSPASSDARDWKESAFVPRNDLVGTAFVIFWPPHRTGACR